MPVLDAEVVFGAKGESCAEVPEEAVAIVFGVSAGTLEASELTPEVPEEGYLLGTYNEVIIPVEDGLETVGATESTFAEDLVPLNTDGVLLASEVVDLPPNRLSFLSPDDPKFSLFSLRVDDRSASRQQCLW